MGKNNNNGHATANKSFKQFVFAFVVVAACCLLLVDCCLLSVACCCFYCCSHGSHIPIPPKRKHILPPAPPAAGPASSAPVSAPVVLLMVGKISHYLRRVLAPSKQWLGMGLLNHQQYCRNHVLFLSGWCEPPPATLCSENLVGKWSSFICSSRSH